MGLLLAGLAPAAASDLPKASLPPGVESQWVTREMTYNGLPMSIRTFRTRLTVDEVVRHYADEWKRRYDRDPRRERRGGWHVIMVGNGEHFISVRAQSRGSEVHGVITVSADPSDIEPSRETELPLPHDVRVASRQRYRDGAQRGEHLLLASPLRVGTVVERFHDELESAGWQVVTKRESKTGEGRLYREYQRGGAQLQLSFGPARKPDVNSIVTATWIKP